MTAAAYDAWDRSAAAARALHHADTSSSRDAGGGIWNFAFGSNMSASKVAFVSSLLCHALYACVLLDAVAAASVLLLSQLTNAAQVLSRGIKPLRSLPARVCGWRLLFNHKGGYANIESLDTIQEQNMDVSHLPQPLPEVTLGVLLLVR
jgi:hypothetical protein